MHVCTFCGWQLDQGARFCSRCGAPIQAPAVSAPPPGQPQTPPWTPPPTNQRPGGARGLALVLGIVGLVLVLAAVGTFVWLRARGGGDGDTSADRGSTSSDGYGEDTPLGRSVTSSPEEVWTYDVEGNSPSLTIVGGWTLLSSGGGSTGDTPLLVIGLDETGEETWTHTRDGGGYLTGPAEGSDVVYLVPWSTDDAGDQRMDAISAETGNILWSSERGFPLRIREDGVVMADDDAVRLLEPELGDVVWQVDTPSAYGVNDDQLITLEGNTMTSFDLASGEEEWRKPVGASCGDFSCRVTATATLMLVTDSDSGTATAFDPEDGTQLWTEDYEPGQYAGAAGPDLVYLEEAPDTTAQTDGRAVLFDRDGRIGEAPIDADDYIFSPLWLTIHGADYILDWASRTLYDSSLERIESFDGPVDVTGEGFYTTDGRDLVLRKPGDADPVWTLALDGDAVQVAAADGAVLVLTADELTRYE